MDPILFGPFCLDIDQRRFFRDGTDFKLRPQAVRVFRVLPQKAGQSVHHDQLLKEAWDGTFISRHTVATTVSEIRKALEEYGAWIEYRPRIGYALKVYSRRWLCSCSASVRRTGRWKNWRRKKRRLA